jgi:uncharacterized repeat protein (TIGR03803 family)
MSKLNWGMRAVGIFLLWATTAIALPAQTFTLLHSFCSQTNCTDGEQPYAGLIQGTDGNLYGTTDAGGANGFGTAFKVTTNGALTSLYSFCSHSMNGTCTDGYGPGAPLVQGTNGAFYGTTQGGGLASCNNGGGCGTLFSITAGGKLKTLHDFDLTDGYAPMAALIEGANGKFYGTTPGGGSNGLGTVFNVTAGGTLKTLYSFGNGTDGTNPNAGLVQAANGKFYGTAFDGGNSSSRGTVFSITASGTLKTIYDFCSKKGCPDGADPYGPLVQAPGGSFYGTTAGGGRHSFGTVFSITAGGKLKILHSFTGTDGDDPQTGLVLGTDGNFYGTTYEGGANCSNTGCGTIFEITPSGTLMTLYNFCSQGGSNCTDGSYPDGTLVQDTNGIFYGTTQQGGGGANGGGTVFSLSVGLGPFVKTNPTSGMVGAAVTILGTNLTAATSVTFNGTTATFTVKSKSEITTTVPIGATTGKVEVVTPGGTLSSNVPFTVD